MTNEDLQTCWNEIAKIAVLTFEYNLDDNKNKMASRFKEIEYDFIYQRNNNEDKIGKINSKIRYITNYAKIANNKKLSDQAKNLAQVMSGFNKTLNNTEKNLALIKKELNNLTESDEPVEKKATKLKILFEKLSFQNVKLDSIQKITKKLYSKLDKMSLGDLDNDNYAKKLKELLDITKEYNISKLKHAQKKFELSKELKDFMYGKKNPKLAHLLSLDSSVPVDSATPLKLMTPFGPVWVKRSSSDNSRMIYLIYLNQQCSKALKYDDMCEELDWKFRTSVKNQHRKDAIERMIKPIIEYINQPLNRGQNLLGTEVNSSSPEYLFSLVKYNYPISKYLTKSQKEAAAFSCGVLLLSESHEFRNPTGGKFERKAMKNVLRLAKNDCTNPFPKAFSNAKGRYLPAGTGKMKNAKLIIEGKLNQRNAEELIKNYIKSEFKKFIDKNKNNLLNGDTVNLKKEFGGGSYKQIINFSRRGGVEKLKNFRNKINENNDTNLKNSFNNISISLDYIEKCKTLNDITLNDLPDEVQIMIKKEKKKINKLMNFSL